jgi:hypothetical protein
MEEKYDIFISYRRKEGNGQSNVDKARSIYYELRARGYSVFFDFEECTDGYFSNKILPAIRTCNYFLLVLTKDALLRCSSKGDWVRREIEEAIRCGRKIIPVSPDGVFAGWPEDLPESLLPLAGEDGGLQVTTIHTDSSFKSDIGLLIDLRMGGGNKGKTVKKYLMSMGIPGALVVGGLLVFLLTKGGSEIDAGAGIVDTIVQDTTQVVPPQPVETVKPEPEKSVVEANQKKQKKERVKEDAVKSVKVEKEEPKVEAVGVKVAAPPVEHVVCDQVSNDQQANREKDQQANREFNRAKKLFNAGQYKRALEIFESLKKDGVSMDGLDVYIQTCRNNLKG